MGTGKSKRELTDLFVKFILLFCAVFSIIALSFIVYFLFRQSTDFITEVGIWQVFTESNWWPATEDPQYGALALIVATFLVSIGAMVIAVPVGIGSAIFISQLAPKQVKDVMKTAVELLAGVPSVVYGLFGMLILVTWIRKGFDVPSGQSWMAGSIILGIMALPTIISISEDAISSVTRDMKEASLALGATKWQTIKEVLVPASISGITAAIILGLGRALGETMAVMMVVGNTPVIPSPIWDIFDTMMPITAALGIETGEASGLHRSALFFLGVILFFIVMIINIIAINIMEKIKKKHLGLAGKKKKFSLDLPDNVKSILATAVKIILYIIIVILLGTWFGTTVGLVAAVFIILSFLGSNFLKPKKSQYVAYTIVSLTMLFTIVSLGIILFYIISEGMGAMSWEFLTDHPSKLGREGGIWPAIVGTFYLVAGAIIMSMPIGVGAGIYLSEYAREGKFLKFIRLGIDTLNGTPSIVFGLFGFAFLVIYLEMGQIMLAGMIVLAIMVLPTIIRTTEESLKSIPQSVREGSLALGANKWETIRKVVLPPSFPGIITGIVLSIGRAAGETAPILFVGTTAFALRPADDLFEPTMALSTHIFYLAKEVPGGETNAFGTAFVLLIIIIITYTIATIMRRRFRNKIKW